MSKQQHYSRRTHFRPERESFLILCEGANTEPNYFNAFRLTTATVRALAVRPGNAQAVVRAAIRRREEETRNGKEYDHYWVVFDKDDTADQIFNEAIREAQRAGFQVAYSNQAFELWFLLHFHFFRRPMHRDTYAAQLSELLGFAYGKDQQTTRRLFQALYNLQSQAIENARRLYEQFEEPRNPAAEESSTTVYELVAELRKYL